MHVFLFHAKKEEETMFFFCLFNPKACATHTHIHHSQLPIQIKQIHFIIGRFYLLFFNFIQIIWVFVEIYANTICENQSANEVKKDLFYGTNKTKQWRVPETFQPNDWRFSKMSDNLFFPFFLLWWVCFSTTTILPNHQSCTKTKRIYSLLAFTIGTFFEFERILNYKRKKKKFRHLSS